LTGKFDTIIGWGSPPTQLEDQLTIPYDITSDRSLQEAGRRFKSVEDFDRRM
jgi:hypothetical protein